MNYDPKNAIEICKRNILRAALNIARLDAMNFHIDDDGNRVLGNSAHEKEVQHYKLREAAKDWLQLLTESSEDNPPAQADGEGTK